MSRRRELKIVYQAYGKNDVIAQALFSTISLASLYPEGWPYQVEIYTDQADRIRGFFSTYRGQNPVIIVSIHPEQIKRWRGAIDFVHRVKLEILREASRNWAGDLVYMDGDTYFAEKPDDLFAQISPSTSVMHIREHSLAEPRDVLTKKIAKFVKKKKFSVGGEEIEIPPQTYMWNAGVIGMANENLRLLGGMIDLTDVLYSQYEKHVMEQLAVSYYLQTAGTVVAAEPVIKHYWNQKEDFDRAIRSFLLQHSDFQSALSYYTNFPWPPKPMVKSKPWYRSLFGG